MHSGAWAVSLRYRDFRLFWASTLCYSLGTGMEAVAVGWLVFEITDSAFMVGVASAARMAPMFFLGILSGAMADWLERRLFLFFSALAGVAIAAIMATILLAGDPHVWAVIVLVGAGGCVLAFTLTISLSDNSPENSNVNGVINLKHIERKPGLSSKNISMAFL